MFNKVIEKLTGKDDVERVAETGDLQRLNDYLKTRRLLFPKKPMRFLDAATFTQEELLELVEQESKDLGGDQLKLWVLEMDGRKRLPAFSSQKKMEAFSAGMSKGLNKVFSLGCVEMLLSDVTKEIDVDVIDLNRFSGKSWEIEVANRA